MRVTKHQGKTSQSILRFYVEQFNFSVATTWALFALTQSPDVQVKLRNELLSVSTDNPTMEELNALPYLDAVVRETLRLHAPVSSTARQAMKDDIIPLSIPFTDKKGVVHHEIRSFILLFRNCFVDQNAESKRVSRSAFQFYKSTGRGRFGVRTRLSLSEQRPSYLFVEIMTGVFAKLQTGAMGIAA